MSQRDQILHDLTEFSSTVQDQLLLVGDEFGGSNGLKLLKEDGDITDYVASLMKRLSELNSSVEKIEQQASELTVSISDTQTRRKEKMIMLTELFNEVHLLCGEVRQLVLHTRTVKKLEMMSDSAQALAQSEEEINRVLRLLSKLKSALHEKISSYIEMMESREPQREGRAPEEASSRSVVDTDGSVGTESTSMRSAPDSAQLRFIFDYVESFIKNVEEIQASLIKMEFSDSDPHGLKDKMNDLGVLERHLNRNEPMIKEIEFWLCHDFSKPLQKDEGLVTSLKEKMNQLNELMSQTTSLLLRKTQLLHKELENEDLLKQGTDQLKRNHMPSRSFSDSSRNDEHQENLTLREYKRNRKREREELLKDVKEAEVKILRISRILESVNQTLDDNRFISVTNDSVVAQQGYVLKMQSDLLRLHRAEFDWLCSFTNPVTLSKVDVPDKVLFQIMSIKSTWHTTNDRVGNTIDTLSKIREFWILFEYYTVRIMLWNKALSINDQRKSVSEWKREAEVMKTKLERARTIKRKLNGYLSDLSRTLIDKLWNDTQKEFNSLVEQL